MIQQSKGKIFLADERGCSELNWFRSYNTFQFGVYTREHKTPFGSLYVLNDDTLAGGQYISMVIEEDTTVVLLPVVGAITITDSTGYSDHIEAGQCRLHTVRRSTTITIGNPFDQELVNFLQLWIKRPAASADIGQQKVSFDLDGQKNQLVELSSALTAFIGKFDGRSEIEYQVQHPGNGVFVFVIEGAFEVQYRLLHARDGLGLWDTDTIELEALSNDAIVLLLEIPL